MLGPAHETMVEMIRANPQWFSALLTELAVGEIPAGFEVADTSVRVVNAIETHPDVLFTMGKVHGPWKIVELQHIRDPEKQRQWLLAVAGLLHQRGEMGDLIVVTHQRATARWARTVASAQGRHGTRIALEPVVVLITRTVAEKLLATGRPELAMFAAWAVHHQRGAAAVTLVKRAMQTVQKEHDVALREVAIRAMLNMLGGSLREAVYEMVMDFSKIPEGPVHKYIREKFEERGERRGERRGEGQALLRVLARRGFVVDEAVQTKITTCKSTQMLDLWIDRAVTATTLAEVFSDDGDVVR